MSLGYCLGDLFCSQASAINLWGLIVGSAIGRDSKPRAVLWQKDKIYELNVLIPTGTEWLRLEEATAIIKGYQRELTQSRVAFKPAPGAGCHATEAPRGLLYHRYRIGDDGLIAEAKIVPPTSQNLRRIEEDLRVYVPKVAGFDDPEATRRCEHLIRNYDPCISCATHFLKMKIER